MKRKFIFSILFLLLPIMAFAEDRYYKDIIIEMVDNIKVENSRSITIPGQKGVLRIYIESNKVNPHSIELVVIDYNNKKTSFQAGNNFLITQDDKLVFGKYNDVVYAKAYNKPQREHLTIKHNSFFYDFTEDNIKISAGDNSFMAEEVLYNKSKSQFTIFNNSAEVKLENVCNINGK